MTQEALTAWFARCSWLSVAASAMAALAQPAQPPADEGFVRGAKALVDVRVRSEHVDQANIANEADAPTVRARLGFETGRLWDTKLLVEGEFVEAFATDYNDTLNGRTAYPVVADVEDDEINRAQLSNTSLPATVITLGRQRLILDDHRFIGNSGWRQNEQTFDALRVTNKGLNRVAFDVGYIDQVNRIFGPSAPAGRFQSDSVFANAIFTTPVGQLTLFNYLLELTEAPLESSASHGLRLSGEKPAGKAKLGYLASFAEQSEHGNNPLRFSNGYALLELSAKFGAFTVAPGVEVLEGNGTRGFTTPLATGHLMQGWSDVIATPAGGVEDRYLRVGYSKDPRGPLSLLAITARYHDFASNFTGAAYGTEANLQLQLKWKTLTTTLKYAAYDAETFGADTDKVWLQVEYVR